MQLQGARQLCSGGIVWLHDKISRITIWGQSCTRPAQASPAQPSPVSRPSGEQRAALLLYLEVSLMATSSCYFYNLFHFYIFRPSCDEFMSGCFSFLITSDWIVKVQGSSSGLQCLDPVTRQLVICPKKFGSLSRLTGKLQRASQWSGHHNYVYLRCPHLCTAHCAHCWAPLNAMFCLVIIVLAGDKTQEKNWGNKNVTSQNTFKYSYHVLLPISIDSLLGYFHV